MTSVWQDIRFGLRMLARQPGFTVVALVVLSLGIGANTAAFSLVNVLLLKPRVGQVDDQLTGVYARHRTQANSYRAFTYQEFADLRERDDLFAHLAAHGFGMAGLAEGDATRRVFVDIVTAGFFETFGVMPALGRPFTRQEERPGAGVAVAILSHSLWQRMGGTPDVVGRQVEINTRPYTVVGVAPEGFGGSMVMVTPELWVPTGTYDQVAFDLRNQGGGETLADPSFRTLILVGRLAPGATIASVVPGVDALSDALSLAEPEVHGDYRLELAPLSRLSVSTRPQVDDELTGLTAALLSLSGLVLLVASLNLANMLLARGRLRRRELAIRLAIGSSRRRLVRQLVTEGLVLATLGGAGGVLVASVATRLLFTALPPVLPISLSFDTSPDLRVLAATAGFSVAAALLFSLWPAWRVVRADTLPDLRQQTSEGWSRRAGFPWMSSRDALVTGQLALTLVLVTVGGLFMRGALEAARADPGFTLDRGVIANLDAALADYDPARGRDLYRRALSRLAAEPGVVSVGLASHMPFGEFQEGASFQLPGPPVPLDDPTRSDRVAGATLASISSGYFDAVGLPFRSGRDFTDAEAFAEGAAPIAIIDEVLAQRLFGDQEAVGRSIQRTTNVDGGERSILRVVGVVAEVRADLIENEPTPFVYEPLGQSYRSNVYLHARTAAATPDAETAMLPAIRRALQELAPRVPLVSLETRPAFRDRNLLLAMIRTGAGLFVAFGLAALLLAGVGVYGVKAYLVSNRTREIGVRMALGAAPRDVVAMMLREGLVSVGLGLLAGVGLSLVAGQLLRGLLFQGTAFDVPVVAGATVTMVAAVLLASWVPTRRATAIHPVRALRAE